MSRSCRSEQKGSLGRLFRRRRGEGSTTNRRRRASDQALKVAISLRRDEPTRYDVTNFGPESSPRAIARLKNFSEIRRLLRRLLISRSEMATDLKTAKLSPCRNELAIDHRPSGWCFRKAATISPRIRSWSSGGSRLKWSLPGMISTRASLPSFASDSFSRIVAPSR